MPNTLRDLVQPADLIATIRQLQFPQFTLVSELPRRTRSTVDYQFMRGANPGAIEAAGFRAFDAEAPIGRRPGMVTVKGSLPPVSRKIPLTEGDRLAVESLNGSPLVEREFVDAIFNDAATMTRAVEARLEQARGDALVDGIVTIAENGLQFTIDYGVPATHKVSAATPWSTIATADVIGDIRAWQQVYIDDNGSPPDHAIASTRVIGYMMQNAGIRGLLASSVGGPSIVTRDQLAQVLSGYGLPPVIPYDVQVTDLAGVKTRIIPDDRFIMLPASGELGSTQYGATAEALELAQDGLLEPSDVPGITAVAWRSPDPVQTWTKAAAISLPVIQNPSLLFSADVA